MGLAGVPGALNSRRGVPSSARFSVAGRPLFLGLAVTALIAGPWLSPGYIFGTDWPGPARFGWPSDFSSAAPALAALALVSKVVSAQITGKLLILAILFGGTILAYQAVPAGGFVARAAGAIVYMVNPFVFGRLHYGQLFLLGGYALLPWAAYRIRALLTRPGVANALQVALSLALIGTLTAHLLALGWILVIAELVAYIAMSPQRRGYLAQVGPYILVSAAVAAVLTAYWTIPLLLGRGQIAASLVRFSGADLAAFQAVPDRQLGLLPNLLGLYGFWAEATGRFTSMKDFVPLWPAALAALLLLCAFGAARVLQGRQSDAPWVVGLLLASVAALVLESGVSNPLTAPIANWLDVHFIAYRGMRDAGKWAALIAIAYSQFAGYGAAALLEVSSRWKREPYSNWAVASVVGVLLALPLYYGNGLLYGMHGEIRPSDYPAGWYAARAQLDSDPHPGRVLFLPWHEYMGMSFVRNQNHVIAPPAPSFFDVPVVVSVDPEVPGLTAPSNPDQAAIDQLVRAGAGGDWAHALADRQIKYVLVAREADWESYDYLDSEPGVTKVADFGSIALYSVSASS